MKVGRLGLIRAMLRDKRTPDKRRRDASAAREAAQERQERRVRLRQEANARQGDAA